MSKKNIQSTIEHKNENKFLDSLALLKTNPHLLHLSVTRQLNNQRAGTASTKTRSEVRGGGKKPWKQKGTGRARAGSIRSPLWVGGGISFGPKPRIFNLKLSKTARNLALAQALGSKRNEIVVLKNLPELKEIKTKVLLQSLNNLNLNQLSQRPLLLICSLEETGFNEVKKASRNIPDVHIVDNMFVGVLDVLKAKTVVITESALQKFEKRFRKAKVA